MESKEAIEFLYDLLGTTDHKVKHEEAVRFAENVIEKLESYNKQWLDDMNNPLEPLKLASALNSEIIKLEYRKASKPKEISILDYTVIYALKDCLERYSK